MRFPVAKPAPVSSSTPPPRGKSRQAPAGHPPKRLRRSREGKPIKRRGEPFAKGVPMAGHHQHPFKTGPQEAPHHRVSPRVGRIEGTPIKGHVVFARWHVHASTSSTPAPRRRSSISGTSVGLRVERQRYPGLFTRHSLLDQSPELVSRRGDRFRPCGSGCKLGGARKHQFPLLNRKHQLGLRCFLGRGFH